MKANKIKNAIAATALFIFVMSLMSCDNDKAHIRVMNALPNIQLKYISFDDYSVAYSLLPGETSDAYEIVDYPGGENELPVTSVVKFYMTKGDNQVYLETKEKFTLDKDDNLFIRITPETELTNGLDWGRQTLKLSEEE